MKRAELLDTAKEFVTRDRNATHGEPEDNFGTIAAYWSARLEIPITSADVAIMMNLMKCARLKANPAHADNWIDGIDYLACGGELALRERT